MSCNRDHANAATEEAGIPPGQARAVGANPNFHEQLKAAYGRVGDASASENTVQSDNSPAAPAAEATPPPLDIAAAVEALARQAAAKHCPQCGQFLSNEGGHACPPRRPEDGLTPRAAGGPPQGWGHIGAGLDEASPNGRETWAEQFSRRLSAGDLKAKVCGNVLRLTGEQASVDDKLIVAGRVLGCDGSGVDRDALVERLQTPEGRAEQLKSEREAWRAKTRVDVLLDKASEPVVADYLALGGELETREWAQYPGLAIQHEHGAAAKYWNEQRTLAEVELSEFVPTGEEKFFRAMRDAKDPAKPKMEAIDGRAVELAGLKRAGLEFFVYKDGSKWTVCEAATGLAVQTGRTRAESIQNADERIQAAAQARGVTRAEAIHAIRAESIARHGITPRYTRQPPAQGVGRCPKCGQFIGRAAHTTCNPAQAKAWRAIQRPQRADLAPARRLLRAQIKQMGVLEGLKAKDAERHARYTGALHAFDRARADGDARAALGHARHAGVRRCPLCGDLRSEAHECDRKALKAYNRAHPYADAYPQAFATSADFANWLRSGESEKTFGSPGNWRALDGVRDFDQKYMAVFCDTPQDVERVRGHLAYIMTGPLRVKDFKMLPGSQASDGRGRMFLCECDWEKSGRTDFFTEASGILEKQLRDGTDIRLTERAGAGTVGTRAFEGLGSGVRVAFASKRETDDEAIIAAVKPFEAALAEAGIPLRQAYAAALGDLHRFIPRCSCGRFMSPVNPVCQNPVHDRRRDGLFGVMQEGKRRDWPPAGYTFKGKKLLGAVRPGGVVEYVAPEPPPALIGVVAEPDNSLPAPVEDAQPLAVPVEAAPMDAIRVDASTIEELVGEAEDKQPWKNDKPWRFLRQPVVYFNALRDRLAQLLAWRGVAPAETHALATEALHDSGVEWQNSITEAKENFGQDGGAAAAGAIHDVSRTPYALSDGLPPTAIFAEAVSRQLNPDARAAIRAVAPALEEAGLPVAQALAAAAPTEPPASPAPDLQLDALREDETFEHQGARYVLLAGMGNPTAMRLNADGTRPTELATAQLVGWNSAADFERSTGRRLAGRCSQCGQYADETHVCPVVPRAEDLPSAEPTNTALGNGRPEAVAAVFAAPAPPLADAPVSAARQRAAQNPDPLALVTGERVGARRNPKGGLDIQFASELDAFLQDKLKSYGFRHSKKTGLWHGKEDQHALEFVNGLDIYNRLAAREPLPALPATDGRAVLERGGDGYYMALPGLGGEVMYEKVAEAWPVTIQGYADLDLFLHDVRGRFHVSDARTGYKLADGLTREQALQAADLLFRKHGSRYPDAIRARIDKGDISPRYGVRRCPTCQQYMGETHTCPPGAPAAAAQPAPADADPQSTPAPVVVQSEVNTPAGREVAFGVRAGDVTYLPDGSRAEAGNWRPVTDADREAYKVWEKKRGKWGDRARRLAAIDPAAAIKLAAAREAPALPAVAQAPAAEPVTVRPVTLGELYAEAERAAGEVDVTGRGRQKLAQQVAQVAYSQIDSNAKMCMAARNPTAVVPPVYKGREAGQAYGSEYMPGVEFAVNIPEDAGGGFVRLPEDYNPARPKHVMRVLLDEGADTYVIQRVKKGTGGQAEVVEWEQADVYMDELGDRLVRMATGNAPYESYERALRERYGVGLAEAGIAAKLLDHVPPDAQERGEVIDRFCARVAAEGNLRPVADQPAATPALSPAPAAEQAAEAAGAQVDALERQMDAAQDAGQLQTLGARADVARAEQQAHQDTAEAAERGAKFYLCGGCGHEFWPRYQADGEPARCPDCGAAQSGVNQVGAPLPNGRTYGATPVAAADAAALADKSGGAVYAVADDGRLVRGGQSERGYVVLPGGAPETVALTAAPELEPAAQAAPEPAMAQPAFEPAQLAASDASGDNGAGGGEDPVTVMLKSMQEQLARANATLAQLKAEGDALQADLGGIEP